MTATLSKSLLERFEQAFAKDPKNILATNALAKNDMRKAIENRAFYQTTNHVYSHKIKKEGKPVTNQKASGRCWIFAMLNAMRLPFVQKHKLKEDKFQFSQSYLFFYDKLEKSNYFLDSIIKTRDEASDSRVVHWLLENLVNDGGQWDMLVNLVEKYGVVPQDVYPESFSSSASRHLNWFLKTKLREYACKLRKMIADGVKDEELHKKREEYMEEVYRILVIFLGKPPSKFTWTAYAKASDKEDKEENKGEEDESKKPVHEEFIQIKDISPLDFYKEHVPFDLNDYVCLINAPTKDKPFYRKFTVRFLGNVVGAHPVRYINIPSEELANLTMKQIRDGSAVWFGCDMGARYIEPTNGIGSMEIFDYMSAFSTKPEMNKAERLDFRDSLMTHAMLFTGVDIVDEKPVKFRVENSWGKKSGKEGYLLWARDLFDEYVYECAIEKKYLSEKMLKALEEDAVVLDPWDPCGALACSDCEDRMERD